MFYYISSWWNGIKRFAAVGREEQRLSGDVRHNIRITYKSNRETLLQTINTYLHQSSIIQIQPSYDFSVNFYQLHRNLQESQDVDGKTNVGALAMEYIVGFIRHLSAYTEEGRNTDHIKKFNQVVKRRMIKITTDEHLRKHPACRIHRGTFEINYDPDHCGAFPAEACKRLKEVIANAFDEQQITANLDLPRKEAEQSLNDEWKTTKEASVRNLFKRALENDQLTLVANLDDIWPLLEHHEKNKRVRDVLGAARRLGPNVAEHFEKLLVIVEKQFTLEAEKIPDDKKVKLFREHVPQNKIILQVVDDADDLGHQPHVCRFEAGALVLKATPAAFVDPEWVDEAATKSFLKFFHDHLVVS